MDLYLVSNLIISLALLFQLNDPFVVNKMTFGLFALATFIMAYAHMKYGTNHKYNYPLKVINGLIALMIVYKIA